MLFRSVKQELDDFLYNSIETVRSKEKVEQSACTIYFMHF